MGRKYTFEGKDYPSVTTVLGLLDKSPALMGWATGCMEKYIVEKVREFELNYDDLQPETVREIVKEARFNYRDVSKDAMAIGTEVHNLIEQHIKAKINGTEFDIKGAREEVENGYLAFLEWEKENVVKYHETEMNVYNKESGYAGTLDNVSELKDGLYTIDFKTSKGGKIYDEAKMQVSAYANSDQVKEKYGDTGIGVLALDKETGLPNFETYSKEQQKRELNSFLKLLDFYYSKNRLLKNNPRVIGRLKKEVK